MSNPQSIDKDFDHLYPDFRNKCTKTIEQANTETEGKFPGFVKWVLFEGFRSQARQAYLYAQGRSRPGSKVTNAQTSPYHNRGIAADIVWLDAQGDPHWDGKSEMWAVLGHCARANGLEWGGDWGGSLGDVGHIQIPKTQLASVTASVADWKQSINLA